MSVILTYPDGKEHRTEFHEVETADRAILSRMESDGEPNEREVLTTYRASAERPKSYPSDLPFVVNFKTHTNEFPGSQRPPRARWPVFFRSSKVFDEVVRQSVESGWAPDDRINPPFLQAALRKVFLRRSNYVRRISQQRAWWLTSLVELEDVPSDVMDRFIRTD